MNDKANEWLAFARRDLQSAGILLREGIYSHVVFHVQQCVEKCLKAVLVHQEKSPPRTHSIADLLQLVPASFRTTLPDGLVQLDVIYTPTRYPDTLPDMFLEELIDLKKSKEMLAWATEVFEKTLQQLNA